MSEVCCSPSLANVAATVSAHSVVSGRDLVFLFAPTGSMARRTTEKRLVRGTKTSIALNSD